MQLSNRAARRVMLALAALAVVVTVIPLLGGMPGQPVHQPTQGSAAASPQRETTTAAARASPTLPVQASTTRTPAAQASPQPDLATASPGEDTPAPAATTPPATTTPTLPPAATASARPGCLLYPSTDVPHDIPDDSPLGVTSSLTVPGPGLPVGAVGVRIDVLRHPYVGDLRLHLIAPDGTRRLLVDRVGNDTDDFFGTAFYEGAPRPISAGVGPFTGDFEPDEALAPLAGLPAGGEWGLQLSDLESGDTGTLYAWALEICPAVVPLAYDDH